MTLQHRIDLLVRLGNYLLDDTEDWKIAKLRATQTNPWFVPEFIDLAAANIATMLTAEALQLWVSKYNLPDQQAKPVLVGVVMAGNIPMVGFHDLLCTFVSGHKQMIKLSSKDDVLIKHLVAKLIKWNAETGRLIVFAETLKNCDAYIATGSSNSGRYFEYYFAKYPNIIRKNRTSIAILTGNESATELEGLADDIQMYFGLGCRNVTKLYVPENYNFEALLTALEKYSHFRDFHKYMNNYDYQLALLMMGNKFYMTNGTVLLSQNTSVFSAVSQVHYQIYKTTDELADLEKNELIQCIVGSNIKFGNAQKPSLTDYADGIDTMQFLLSLS